MLDTNICIYIIKKKTEKILKQLKNKKKHGLSISSITLAELEFANENSMYKEKNKIALMEFLTIIDIKQFDENAAKEYGRVKKDLKDKKCLIGPFDMLIGAHAKSLNLILVTNNTKEFERIKDLKIENWV
ncbi:MAG: type II toxin-antitoxin system VapC family toxin [Treponema sp.]|jgi:tRNA(fMet)-specific endonuclease VapC|nr:type II toxin-antitoxin system VapC family toxin [Treponema sp.]